MNDEDDWERMRVALTGLRYPFNTDKNLALKKQMLEIEVLDKLADKLSDDEDFEDDDEDDEDLDEDENDI